MIKGSKPRVTGRDMYRVYVPLIIVVLGLIGAVLGSLLSGPGPGTTVGAFMGIAIGTIVSLFTF